MKKYKYHISTLAMLLVAWVFIWSSNLVWIDNAAAVDSDAEKSFEKKIVTQLFSRFHSFGFDVEKCIRENCGFYRSFYSLAGDLHARALQEYQEKFPDQSVNITTADELKDCIALANNGDVQAMSKLYRYYKNPRSSGYSFLEDEANTWLLKMIKVGSKDAMIEKGYGRSYATMTTVEAHGIEASVISNCDPIETGMSMPICFLYRLQVAENKKTPTQWTIIPEKNTEADLSPITISIVEQSGIKMVELLSLNQRNGSERKDYFLPSGAYLWGTAAESQSPYFYEYRHASAFHRPDAHERTGKLKNLVGKDIGKFPIYENFVVEEKKRLMRKDADLNPPFFMSASTHGRSFTPFRKGINIMGWDPRNESNTPYLRKDEQALDQEINKFMFDYGYHPFDMPSNIFCENFDEYLERALAGDIFAFQALFVFYKNPLSFIHGEEFVEQKALLREHLVPGEVFFKKTPPAILKGLLDDEFPATGGGQAPLHPKVYKAPYITGHTARIHDRLISAEILCTGYDYDPKNDGDDYYYGRNNCYAVRLSFSLHHGTKLASWIFLTKPFRSWPREPGEPYPFQENGLYQADFSYIKNEDSGLISLETWDGADFFNLDGLYQWSYSESLMAYDEPRKALLAHDIPLRPDKCGCPSCMWQPKVNYKKEYKTEYSRYLHQLPQWEDVLAQIMKGD